MCAHSPPRNALPEPTSIRRPGWLKRRGLLVALSVGAAMVIYALLVYRVYTWRGNTHPDFFIEWTASQVAFDGENPYSNETMRAIQLGSKGRLVEPGEDQLAFVYPLYRVFFNLPITLLPYPWATAVWQTMLQASLMAGVFLFVRCLDWRPTPVDLLLILLTTVLSYHTLGGVVLGQMAVVVLALLLVAFWAVHTGHDWLAGCCLALATVKPQLAILAAAGLLLWSLAHRRRRPVGAFVITLALLLGASFVLFPAWLSEFIRVLTRYPSYRPARIGPSLLLAGEGMAVWAWSLELATIGFLVVSWWLAMKKGKRAFTAAFVVTLSATAFALPQTSGVDRMVLLPAVLFLMRTARHELVRAAVALMAVAGSWAAYFCFYEANYELSLALPPLVVLGWLAWWYVAARDKWTRQAGQRGSPAVERAP